MAESRNRENGPLEEEEDEIFARLWAILSENREEAERHICCLREEIERTIPRLHEIANSTDTTNKGLVASDTVSGLLNATSCIVAILGITLTPVTAGTGLTLIATGIGLATVAEVTRDFNSRYEEFNLKKKEKANELVKNCAKSVKNSKEKLKGLGSSIFEEAEDMMEKIIDSDIADQASNMCKAVKNKATKISVHVKKMKEELEEIPFTKSTGGRVTNGILTLIDEIVTIGNNIKLLTNGTETKAAAEIRKMANKLEEMLLKCDEVREKLKEQKP